MSVTFYDPTDTAVYDDSFRRESGHPEVLFANGATRQVLESLGMSTAFLAGHMSGKTFRKLLLRAAVVCRLKRQQDSPLAERIAALQRCFADSSEVAWA